MVIGIDASRVSKKYKTGTEWYSYHLLKAMSALSSEYTFRLYTNDAVPFALPQNWREQRIAWPFDFLWTQGGLSIEMLAQPPDWLFVPSHAIPLIHPKKTLVTIHDVGFLEWHEYTSRNEHWYLRWSTQYACSHADRIIAISEFTKKELVRLFRADPKNIHVVHLGIDAQRYQGKDVMADDNQIIESYGVRKPFILFVGRIDSRKNIARLANSFERLKRKKKFDGSLVLIGPSGYDGTSIIEQINALEYAHEIHFLGWIREDDKYAFLRNAESFVFPSLYEGFGLPVIEAQCAGTPVICSNTTSLPEVAGEGARFVDPLSEESIASGIYDVMADRALRASLIEKGTTNARRFSWDTCAKETLKLLL